MIYDAFGKIVAEYGGSNPQDEGGVKYYLQDWQGSVRAGINAGGYVKSRTDHQAFGEDIASGVGLRTTAQGYGAPATNRQGYGLTEKDSATGLNHTWFRKNENRAGRWTSPDPYNGSASVGNPQSWNRYSYVENQPTNFVDPSGLLMYEAGRPGCVPVYRWSEEHSNWVISYYLCVETSNTITPHTPYTGPIIEPGGGGGGGGGIEDKVKTCGEALGVTITNFVASSKGKDGSAKITGSAIFRDGIHQAGVGNYLITNDVTSFSGKDLVAFGGGDLGATFYSGDLVGTLSNGTRVNQKVGPVRNYTANDLKNSVAILASQIHELGNSIYMLLGKRFTAVDRDKDAGAAFENCVFGGLVDKNGRLT